MNPTTYQELYNAVKEEQIVAAIDNNGKKHRLFIANNGYLCCFMRKSSRRGYRLSETEFSQLTKFVSKPTPKTEDQKLKKAYTEIAKYKRMAQQASFSNGWIEDCKKLPNFEIWKKDVVTEQYGSPCEPRQKNLYDYGITTGNKIDAKVISLSRIAKEFPRAVEQLRQGIKEQKAVGSVLFGERFAGYDIRMSLEQRPDGICGYLALEYKGCGNGYYYFLINDENFIGYDID